jgi:DNA ligase D-like protein (predicted ligase)
MPQRIEPALALLARKPPTGDQWAYEVKWDGYRLAVHVESTGVRIITRGGHDWTSFFPAIATAAKALGPATMILDGEAVVLDDKGLPNFGLLQQALGGRRATRAAGAAIFYAFDLLYFDGHNLTGLELSSRRHMLTTLLNDRPGDAIRLSETIEADGESLLRNACAHGLEGIIAKDINSPYRSGRRGDWLKIKCCNRKSFAVIGYEPSQKVQGSIASLLLAARKDDKLVYVGNGDAHLQFRVQRATKLGLSIEVQQLKMHTSDDVVPIISAAIHNASTFVPAPEVPVDGPNRSLRCQSAMQIAFQNMAERAMAAGWREQEVAAALVDLADNHMLTFDSNQEIKEATKSAISKLGSRQR